MSSPFDHHAREFVWLATREEAGDVRFRLGRRGDELVAEWPHRARLTVRRDGTAAELVFADEVQAADRRKLERGGAALLVRQLEGKLSLHGSAVAFGDRALVMLGDSGHGKSTLAAALCAAGGELLSDDAVAIDLAETETVVHATECDHWLDAAACDALGLMNRARNDKAPIPALAVRRGPVSVAGLIALIWRDDQDSVVLSPARDANALARVLPNIVRLVVDEPALQRAELDGLHRVLESVPVFVLARPRRFDLLPAAVDLLVRLCLNEREDPR